ncbi:52 kDa repressor of the inhibitor of the protein kinase-like [Dreissena polymorpha]|uniref:52 kDa repressor of the inhibitor of the protein kinase-like n=1 Tax=Dreissena polymorpha TaxID=45954 RepID=UPI002263EFD3|nr:52 kDa repressor of the inhibitor of the protein kinase-like [Dreissena polymorpha]
MPDQPQRRKLKELCRTRWVQRHDAFEVFLDFLPATIDAIENILEYESRPDSLTDANGILSAITSFPFIIALVIALRCLAYIKSLSIVLQGRELDSEEALKNVRHVKDTLQNKRDSVDNFHGCLYEEAVAVAKAVGVDPSIPRRCCRQTQRNNIPADTPETYYKRV